MNLQISLNQTDISISKENTAKKISTRSIHQNGDITFYIGGSGKQFKVDAKLFSLYSDKYRKYIGLNKFMASFKLLLFNKAFLTAFPTIDPKSFLDIYKYICNEVDFVQIKAENILDIICFCEYWEIQQLLQCALSQICRIISEKPELFLHLFSIFGTRDISNVTRDALGQCIKYLTTKSACYQEKILLNHKILSINFRNIELLLNSNLNVKEEFKYDMAQRWWHDNANRFQKQEQDTMKNKINFSIKFGVMSKTYFEQKVDSNHNELQLTPRHLLSIYRLRSKSAHSSNIKAIKPIKYRLCKHMTI